MGGEVTRPGPVDLTGGMTPLQAVINAGGFNAAAKPEAAILIRKGPGNKPVPLRINLKTTIYNEVNEPNIQLQPYDVLYIPKTWIAKANKFVNQYITDLLLFRGFAFGFSYQLHDATNNE